MDNTNTLSMAIGPNRLKRNLLQVHAASKQLRNRTAQEKGPKEMVESLGEIHIDPDQPSIDSLHIKKAINQSAPSLEPTDIDGFMRNQYQNTIVTAIEKAKEQTAKSLERSSRLKMDAEWDASKKELLEELGYRTIGWDTTAKSDSMREKIIIYRSVIEDLAQSKLRTNLAEAFANAVNQVPVHGTDRAEIQVCWKLVCKFLEPFGTLTKNYFNKNKLVTRPEEIPKIMRKQAKQLLEEQYLDFIEKSKVSSFGGTKSDSGPVERFVRGKISSSMDHTWATIYYFVRCGKVDEAIRVARKKREDKFVRLLCLYKEDKPEYRLEIKEDYQYRITRQGNLDPSLKALYAALGQIKFNNQEIRPVITSTQDYMWLRLTSLNDNDSDDSENSLDKLQKDLRKWGPAHFNPKGTNPLLYFQVLLLSQQFEEAVKYLDTFHQYKVEAVHFGCTLYYYGLLGAREYSTGIGFDFEKILFQFIRQFGPIDPPKFALYYFLLHNVDDFKAAMVKFIFDTRQLDMLGISSDGTKTVPAIIDKLPPQIASDIISQVAERFNKTDNFFESIRLYNRAGKYKTVLDIVNHQLGLVLTKPNNDEKRKHIATIARQVYHEYSLGGNESILKCHQLHRQAEAHAKMQRLLDFFDCCQAQPPRLEEACQIQMSLNIIPFQQDDLQRKAQEFASLEDCIKQNFSDILLGTMTVLVKLYNEKDRTDQKREIKHMARCLATFAGMITYQMPGNYNQEFISLQAKIS